MKIFLVLTKINSESQWHVGLAYLAAVLKNGGHDVVLFEIADYQKDVPGFLAEIKA